MSFEGRIAIVTGASRGIGRAISLELARRGSDVVLVYANSTHQAESLVGEVSALGRKAKACQVNVADFGAVESMVKQLRDEFGRIDYLINNAGIIRDKL